MTLKLSTKAFALFEKDYNSGDYSGAYGVAIQDLTAQNPNLLAVKDTPSLSATIVENHDQLYWLTIAKDMFDLGATPQSILIRADVLAAEQYEHRQNIGLYDPMVHDGSVVIAQNIDRQIIAAGGAMPDFPTIINDDAGKGLAALGLSERDWGGSVPTNLSVLASGFYNDQIYNGLSAGDQHIADNIHIAAAAVGAIAILSGKPTAANPLENVAATLIDDVTKAVPKLSKVLFPIANDLAGAINSLPNTPINGTTIFSSLAQIETIASDLAKLIACISPYAIMAPQGLAELRQIETGVSQLDGGLVGHFLSAATHANPFKFAGV